MIVKHNHQLIRTPIDTVNVIGAGGIVMGTITELWGPPGAGKSAYAYDSASMFLEDYPDGVVVVIDPETSTDLVRLEHVFKLDMLRLLIRNARTLEDGYQVIFQIFNQLDHQMDIKRVSKDKDDKKKAPAPKQSAPKEATTRAVKEPTVKKVPVADFIKNFTLENAADLVSETGAEFDLGWIKQAKGSERDTLIRKLATLLAFYGVLRPERTTPILVIWDTIVASKPAAEVEAALQGKDPVNAGGIGLRSRINEENLAIIMSNMEGRSISLFLLNQVRLTGFGSYAGPTETSSGGNALKHNCHYRLGFRNPKKNNDERLMMNIGTVTFVDIEKSKFGPTMNRIPIYIDDRMGGRIRPKDEAALMCHTLKLLNSSGGPWYKFIGEDEAWTWDKSPLSEKSGRWIENNPEARKKCIDVLARHYRMNYVTLDTMYKIMGLKIGELNEAQVKYRQEMIDNFSFHNVITEMNSSDEKDSKNARSTS